MNLDDGHSRIELTPGESVSAHLPTPGDTRFEVVVRTGQYSGTQGVWIDLAAIQGFAAAVQKLDKDRSGQAVLSSMSPDEFQLRLRIVDAAGHAAAEGHLRDLHTGSCLFFKLEFCPSNLPNVASEFAALASQGNLSRIRSSLALETRMKLQEEGEGWFATSKSSLLGSVACRIEGHRPPGAWGQSNPWYVVELDEPLEIQESGHDTPSGLRLVSYSSVLVSPRWSGVRLGKLPESVFVCRVPPGRDPLEHRLAVEQPDVWASCVVVGADAESS